MPSKRRRKRSRFGAITPVAAVRNIQRRYRYRVKRDAIKRQMINNLGVGITNAMATRMLILVRNFYNAANQYNWDKHENDQGLIEQAFDMDYDEALANAAGQAGGGGGQGFYSLAMQRSFIRLIRTQNAITRFEERILRRRYSELQSLIANASRHTAGFVQTSQSQRQRVEGYLPAVLRDQIVRYNITRDRLPQLIPLQAQTQTFNNFLTANEQDALDVPYTAPGFTLRDYNVYNDPGYDV